MKKFLAIIPARGGSKSIPKKNIIDIKGKPLIAWSIEAALKSKYITDVFVSSDDDDILNIAKKFNASTLKRPVELSTDKCKTEPVLSHVINSLEKDYDFLILLQATSPLRNENHINEAIEKLLKTTSSALISVVEPEHSPYKAFKLSDNGMLEGIVNNEYPFMPRQILPKTFYPNGAIYIIKVTEFLKNEKLFIENNTEFYEMSQSDSIDIDTFEDIKKLEFIETRKYNEQS